MRNQDRISPRQRNAILSAQFVLLLAILTLSSCLGGGTIGTGLPGEGFSGSGTLSHTSGRSILVKGTLRDSHGRPISGAHISVVSTVTTVDTVTDASGGYECLVELGTNQKAEIVFTDKELESDFPLTKFSQTSDVVVADFRLVKPGQVKRENK